MTAIPFYKPQPRRPWSDWRMYSMLVPIVSGALGACILMALGFSFTEMDAILPSVRTRMVITAAFAVAFGSTFGSIGSGIEIFRKRFKGEADAWDWISLSISGITTIVGFAMGFAALLGATAEWSAEANKWGVLVVGTLAGLDSMGDLIELGGLFGSSEMRKEKWIEENSQWEQDHGAVEMVTLSKEELVFDPSWPVASIDDARRLISRLNGQLPNLKEDMMRRLLHADEKREKSVHATKRWAREGRKGTL